MLRNIWRKYLKISAVEDNDDFLDVGGHSLVAIQIVSEVNDALGLAVPLSALLRGGAFQKFSSEVLRHFELRNPVEAMAPILPCNSTKPPENTARDMITINGKAIFVLSEPEARHLWREIYEERAYHPEGISFGPGATIVDVGANIGLFSRYALEIFPDNKVVSIEPAQTSWSCLTQNLQQYGSRAVVLPVGCGRENVEFGDFTYFPAVPAMSSFQPVLLRDKGLLAHLLRERNADNLENRSNLDLSFLDSAFEARLEKCPVRTLSSVISELKIDRIDLLKIDVQRGEEDVLAGIEEEHWRIIFQAVVEFQNVDGAATRIAALFEMRGFHTEVKRIAMHRRTDVCFIYAMRR